MGNRKNERVLIENCSFKSDVHFEAGTIEVMKLIAQGLVENAKGLKSLAGLFTGDNYPVIQVGCYIGPNKKEKV